MVIMGDVKGHLTNDDLMEHESEDMHLEMDTPSNGYNMVYITCDSAVDGTLVLEALRMKAGHYK